jgi:isoquinoline 1-oxidoreductase beta subunit
MRRRRFLLAGAAVGGALLVGWGLLPARQRMFGARPLVMSGREFAPNGWVKISADGHVTVMMPRSEMGQGVWSSLPLILAEELDCDPERVTIEQSPIDGIYNNVASMVDGLPFHPDDTGAIKRSARWLTGKLMRELGGMMTGGSSSIKDLWLPLREAGAMARASLVASAARRWSVGTEQCGVVAGVITHPSGKHIGFGEIVATGKLVVATRYALKPPRNFTLLGRPHPRRDSVDKSDGSARFGIDVVEPGMLHAAVAMCPILGGSLLRFDATAAAGLAGVKKIAAVGGFNGGAPAIAVIADGYHRARQALAAVSIEWAPGSSGAGFNTSAVPEILAGALQRDDGFAIFTRGDADAAIAAAAKVIEADYSSPYLAHATMEPMNCTVLAGDRGATVWAPTQVPDFARRAAAAVLGLDEERVSVKVTLLGGGFGRRLEVDFVAQAAAIAALLPGTPVKTLWSREDDLRHDFYRPACLARFKVGIDTAGRLVAWSNTSAGQTIVGAYMPRAAGLPVAGPDKTASEGAYDQAYEIPNVRVAHVALELPVPIGFWRAVGHSHQAFFKESFIDEAAHAAGADAVAFRAALLQNHPRHLAVLRQAASKAGWGTTLAPAAGEPKRARGIALHESFGSIVAEVAEVSLGDNGRIRVHRVVCVIDCGFPVNPNIIAQQLESAVVFGLSAALYGEVNIADGRVAASNFHDYPVLRFADSPRIETHIIGSTAHPEGVGEPGLPPIAAAVGNAIFALSGERLRQLPLRPTLPARG